MTHDSCVSFGHNILKVSFTYFIYFFQGWLRVEQALTTSVLGRIYKFVLLVIWQFYTAPETRVVVQTLVINLLTFIDAS